MAVNTWDKTLTVKKVNARGNEYTSTIPNPNYIPPKPKFDTKGMTAIYGQTAENARGNTRDDPTKLEGYKKDLGNGFVEYYDTKGNLTRTVDQRPTGGGFLGGLGSFVTGTANTAASGVSDFADKFGSGIKTFSESEALPAALAVLATAYTGGAFDPTSLASAGSAAGSAAGAAGATTAPVYGGTVGGWSPLSTAGALTATTAPVISGTTGGWTSLGEAAATGGTAAATGAATGASKVLTPAQIESAVNTAGYGTSAAATAATGALSGTNAYSDSLVNSLMSTLGLDSASVKTMLQKAGVGNVLSTGLNTAGGLLQGQSGIDAAKIQAEAQIKAAQIAADAAKFKPVGVTTGFGSSKFGYDANGNLTSAGYELTPQMKAQRDALLGTSSGLLDQFKGSQAATAGMSTAAERAMALGNQYLATDPQAQAQKYMNDQLGLLAPQRAQDMAALQAQMQAQGRGGFAIGGGVGGQGAANPQMQAFLNAQMQQNNQLAADATRGGMDYANFGMGLVGSGGDMLTGMYGTQTAAFNPYKTALGGAQTIEGLGQNALNLGMEMGKSSTAASAEAGRLLSSGMTTAANTMAPANAYSPWANLLAGGAQALSQYKFGQ